MEKAEFDPEKAVAGAKALLMSGGWSLWMRPEMEARVAAIEKELCEDVDWEKTRELRFERRLLKSWIDRPDATLKEMKKVAAPPKPGGAAAR